MKASPSLFDSFQRLKPREQRVVAGGAVVSVVLMIAVWVVLPFAQHWASRSAQLAEARAHWARLSALVANTGRLNRTLDLARQSSGSDQDRLITGATPALAASALQSLVQRYAGETAVQLERVDAAGEPHPDKPGLLAIPVQLQARGDLYGLVDFLSRLEHGGPLVVIDELNVSAGLDAGDDEARVTAVADAPRQSLMWTLRLHALYEGSAATNGDTGRADESNVDAGRAGASNVDVSPRDANPPQVSQIEASQPAPPAATQTPVPWKRAQ